jgi:pseudouridine synthase
VTSAADEKGRDTVFDHLPEDMPRVMSVGRLDLNSEGLLLLTNDGELKRRLELPSTGWLRKYRVRVNGNPDRGPTWSPCARASPSKANASSRCRSRSTASRAPMPG